MRVAIEKAGAYEGAAIRTAVRRGLESLGGVDLVGRAGETVLLKPNLLTGAEPERAVCTHPTVVEAVLELVHDAGAKAVIADSPAFGSAAKVAEKAGIGEVARRFGVEVRAFHRPVTVPGRTRVFEALTVDRLAVEADRIVNLPKLKAHRQLYYTGAVKNLFGCVPGKRKAWWHMKAGSYERYFPRMLVDNCYLLAPAVTIMDAVVGMEGDGPGRGDPRPVGVVLASTDPVALDRVAVEVAGFDPDRVVTLAAAREMELGTPDLEAIEVVGAPLDEVRVEPFREPDMRPIGFSFPRVVRSSLKNAWITRVEEARAR